MRVNRPECRWGAHNAQSGVQLTNPQPLYQKRRAWGATVRDGRSETIKTCDGLRCPFPNRREHDPESDAMCLPTLSRRVPRSTELCSDGVAAAFPVLGREGQVQLLAELQIGGRTGCKSWLGLLVPCGVTVAVRTARREDNRAHEARNKNQQTGMWTNVNAANPRLARVSRSRLQSRNAGASPAMPANLTRSRHFESKPVEAVASLSKRMAIPRNCNALVARHPSQTKLQSHPGESGGIPCRRRNARRFHSLTSIIRLHALRCHPLAGCFPCLPSVLCEPPSLMTHAISIYVSFGGNPWGRQSFARESFRGLSESDAVRLAVGFR